MSNTKKSTTSQHTLTAEMLSALKHAFDNTARVDGLKDKNHFDVITKYCSSFIHASVIVTQNGKKVERYSNISKYFLLISDVPILDDPTNEQEVLNEIESYYRFDDWLSYISHIYQMMLEKLFKPQLDKMRRETNNDGTAMGYLYKINIQADFNDGIKRKHRQTKISG